VSGPLFRHWRGAEICGCDELVKPVSLISTQGMKRPEFWFRLGKADEDPAIFPNFGLPKALMAGSPSRVVRHCKIRRRPEMHFGASFKS
jgi:hypothetical protein